MRTDEERIKAMHKRAARLERDRRMQKSRRLGAGCAALGFVLVLILAVFMPDISGALAPAGESGSMNASIFSGSSALGYIVTGLLAFILGSAVTLFCYRLKKWRQDVPDDEDDEKDREDQL